MRPVPPNTVWKITCRSCEEAEALAAWLASRIDLDRTLIDTTRSTPNGVEQVQTARHRLGDYFAGIRVLPGGGSGPSTLRLGFERRSDAGRFWKDLMVNILQEIEATPQKPSVVFESKGEPDEVLSRD